LKCGLCGDWSAARRDRERVGRRGAAFRDETGQEAHPGDRSNGSPPTSPREKELGRVREDPLPALPLSLCAGFSPPVLVRKPLAAAIPQVGKGQSAANAQRSLAAFGTLLSSRRRGCPAHKGGGRRPATRRNGLPGSSPPLPRITTGTTGLAGTTVLNHFTTWDYPSPPARLGADLIRVQRVRAGF
jgi:hypothetical protein